MPSAYTFFKCTYFQDLTHTLTHTHTHTHTHSHTYTHTHTRNDKKLSSKAKTTCIQSSAQQVANEENKA